MCSGSILAGGSTIRDYAQPNGELGYFAANWRVYGREGQPCLTRLHRHHCAHHAGRTVELLVPEMPTLGCFHA
jgi:formamidopyrimidine-DNA glycosylase